MPGIFLTDAEWHPFSPFPEQASSEKRSREDTLMPGDQDKDCKLQGEPRLSELDADVKDIGLARISLLAVASLV